MYQFAVIHTLGYFSAIPALEHHFQVFQPIFEGKEERIGLVLGFFKFAWDKLVSNFTEIVACKAL